MTQLETIIKHVERHGSIDSLTAFRMYGITRLAARVHELKGTEHALTALDHKALKGYVTYVPSAEVRLDNLMGELISNLSDHLAGVNYIPPEGLADACIKTASKAMTLSRRHGK